MWRDSAPRQRDRDAAERPLLMHAGHFSFRTAGLRAMACCSRFSTLETPALETCSVLACAMPTCMLLSSCRTHPTHHLSSNNKEQSQADSLTYLIERAAVRHLPHWLCLLAATCALPWCGRGAPQIPVISMHNYWPRAAFLTSQDLWLCLWVLTERQVLASMLFCSRFNALGIAGEFNASRHRLWARRNLVVREPSSSPWRLLAGGPRADVSQGHDICT
jgi:hypothetical protein